MLKIGSIKSKEITKIDKTNEFRNLNAKKASLETTRQSLIELKKQSGKIEEFVNLQNRILEIEQQLQDLGVLLGNFDEENEFCTVRFSLHETREIKISTTTPDQSSFRVERTILPVVPGNCSPCRVCCILYIADHRQDHSWYNVQIEPVGSAGFLSSVRKHPVFFR